MGYHFFGKTVRYGLRQAGDYRIGQRIMWRRDYKVLVLDNDKAGAETVHGGSGNCGE